MIALRARLAKKWLFVMKLLNHTDNFDFIINLGVVGMVSHTDNSFTQFLAIDWLMKI